METADSMDMATQPLQTSTEEGDETQEGEDEEGEAEESDETKEGDEDDSMDALVNNLADELFDVGLNNYAPADDQLDDDELGEVEEYPSDEVQDDQLDEDGLAEVL